MPQNELSDFHLYLSRQLTDGDCSLTPEQCVQKFRDYQIEVQQLHERIQSSIDSGEAKPLDRQALMERVLGRLAEKGITGQ